ncbi:undecaprenyl-phosphate glucose phosphotransferase [Ferrovibrio sp.]|uniref:undecaprenyl-phosphate glucose phosphotransferase n=1 Tax=Ferrovibrio sp. TaxID=1917215 RepID=UPI002616540C|nr:undecaprenyl-phosphate glucose phosphotransferase [Ferrovibrio sp.]
MSLDIASGIFRLLDGAVCLAAALASLLVTMPDLHLAPAYYIAIALLGTIIMMNALSIAGLYRLELLQGGGLPFGRVIMAWSAAVAIVAAVVAVSGVGLASSQNWLLLWLVTSGCVLLALRAILVVRVDQWRQAGRLCRRIAVFGSGTAAQALLQRLTEGRPSTMDHIVVGVYGDIASAHSGRADVMPNRAMQERSVHALCGDFQDLLGEIRREHVDAVIVAPAPGEGNPGVVVDRLRQAAADIYVHLDIPEMTGGQTAFEKIGGVPLLLAERRPLCGWRGIAKAVEDRVFAAFALLLIAPLLALIAILIKLDSPGPVLFRQKRYGLNNRLIDVMKFRTMRHDMCDQTASQLTRRNDPRVTRIGHFLRRTSLDELPQFINVLLGEMSVVGPRPHATAAKAAGLLYQDAVPNYDCRHRMKPGITGLAQVSGWRGETETLDQIRKRVEHDIRYIENWSLFLDAQIILRTIMGGFTGRQAF